MAEASDERNAGTLRERVANAIFQARRKQEIEKISDFEFDNKAFDQAVSRILTAEPEISIITGWALISTLINRAIRYHVSHGSNREIEEFFSGLGPLSTDAGKIRLARLMGWLPKELYDAMSHVRKTRNRLAHDLNTPSEVVQSICFPRAKFIFVEQTISKALSALKPAEIEVSNNIDATDSLGDLQYARICMIILASRAFESILSGPGSLVLGVNSEGLPFYSYDEAPDWVKSLRLSTADAIIRINP